MSELVSYQAKEKHCIITLQNGKVNAISHELLDQLNLALDQAEKEEKIVVLAGQAGIFSAGYDLKEMSKGAEQAAALVKRGSTLCLRMLKFPLPIIAVCTGHAIAQGCFILLSCDYRIGTKGDFKLGLNEVQIGMTMHHAGIELAKARLPKVYLERCVNNAEMFSPEDAVTAGFLDLLAEPEAVLPTAEKVAEMMSKLNLNAHKNTKLKMRKPYLEKLEKAIELDAKGLH